MSNVLHGLCLTFSVVSDIYLVHAGESVVSMFCEELVVEEVYARKPRKQWIYVLRTESSHCIMLQYVVAFKDQYIISQEYYVQFLGISEATGPVPATSQFYVKQVQSLLKLLAFYCKDYSYLPLKFKIYNCNHNILPLFSLRPSHFAASEVRSLISSLPL